MGKKCGGDKSSGYIGELFRKHAPAPGFQCNIAELKDSVFTLNPNQCAAAKFEKSSEVVSNYVVWHYDSGILLVRGIWEGR